MLILHMGGGFSRFYITTVALVESQRRSSTWKSAKA
jgi:hypothetical protein